jgi:hypothetical protein
MKTPVDYDLFRKLLQELEFFYMGETLKMTNPTAQ